MRPAICPWYCMSRMRIGVRACSTRGIVFLITILTSVESKRGFEKPTDFICAFLKNECIINVCFFFSRVLCFCSARNRQRIRGEICFRFKL